MLREIPIGSLPAEPSSENGDLPTNKIRFDEDVEAWKNTRGFQDYALFLRRLNQSVTGVLLPWEGDEPREVYPDLHKPRLSADHREQAINALVRLLDELDNWIDDIPPQPTPQRFGNLAFRLWGKRLEEVCSQKLVQRIWQYSTRRILAYTGIARKAAPSISPPPGSLAKAVSDHGFWLVRPHGLWHRS